MVKRLLSIIKMQNKIYQKYIKKCINLAKRGEGQVSPNPLVGAVIIDKNGNIAGYGWHEKYGEAHAEVNAVNMAEQNGVDVKGGTIFVNLEPCSHYGKTPPCADMIIEKGLKKVVIGCVDPNPIVAGRGIKKLENAGIEVVTGVLDSECKKLNEIFIKNQLEKKVFVAVKIATTLDGKIATKTGHSKWITSEVSRNYVQKLRNKYDAILTGSGTVIADNPLMTCRLKNCRNPIRVIVDSKACVPAQANVFNADARVYLAVLEGADVSIYPKNVEIIHCPSGVDNEKINLEFLLKVLYEKGIRSILVESGAGLNGALFKMELVDKVYQFIAPKVLGDSDSMGFVQGLDKKKMDECIKLSIEKTKRFGPDIMLECDVLH